MIDQLPEQSQYEGVINDLSIIYEGIITSNLNELVIYEEDLGIEYRAKVGNKRGNAFSIIVNTSITKHDVYDGDQFIFVRNNTKLNFFWRAYSVFRHFNPRMPQIVHMMVMEWDSTGNFIWTCDSNNVEEIEDQKTNIEINFEMTQVIYLLSKAISK